MHFPIDSQTPLYILQWFLFHIVRVLMWIQWILRPCHKSSFSDSSFNLLTCFICTWHFYLLCAYTVIFQWQIKLMFTIVIYHAIKKHDAENISFISNQFCQHSWSVGLQSLQGSAWNLEAARKTNILKTP